VGETRELAKFASRTSFEDLPSDLVRTAKVYVLDNLTAGFVGAVQPWSRIVADLAGDLGGKEEASTFDIPRRADVSRAAWINGTMIGAFEIEHIGHSSHPSGTVFPAALALAERDHRDGRALITAMMIGYEVVCRIGRAQTAAVERERGFHNPAANGAFGAAAAAGKLLNLDEHGLAWAFGIAGSSAGGLTEFVWEGAMTKRLHLGRAAQLGLESALLAQRGFTGPSTVLEGRYGYFAAFSPRPALDGLLRDLGRVWLAKDLVIKPYPCHVTSQAIVHAIQQFKNEHPLDPAVIRRVTITVSPRLVENRHLDREPATILGAQYSLPYTAAVALARDMSNPSVFNAQVLEDPTIRSLAKKIDILAGASSSEGISGSAPAEITIEMEGITQTLFARDFPGSPRSPLDFKGATEKFYRCTGPLIRESRAKEILETVQDLERLPDVAALAVLVSGALAPA
jgi:2-methylcitrate dehydratase PrpD